MKASPSRPGQRGIVLVCTLLMLIVMTVLVVSMFGSTGLQERLAGNVREKQRALNVAMAAEQYAEWWLKQGNLSEGTVCQSRTLAAAPQPRVCSNAITQPAAAAWTDGGSTAGTLYQPAAPTADTAFTVSDTGGTGTYYAQPQFYIQYAGKAVGGGNLFRITAMGYGGNANAVAVIESTFVFDPRIKNLGAL